MSALFQVKFGYNDTDGKYVVRFAENGLSKDKCPHYMMEEKYTAELNHHGNLHYILKVYSLEFL